MERNAALHDLIANLRGLVDDWKIGRDEDALKREVGRAGLKLTADAWNSCISELERVIEEHAEED